MAVGAVIPILPTRWAVAHWAVALADPLVDVVAEAAATARVASQHYNQRIMEHIQIVVLVFLDLLLLQANKEILLTKVVLVADVGDQDQDLVELEELQKQFQNFLLQSLVQHCLVQWHL